uniref:enoyl-ACP reductase FabV n=1 Tax=Thaumasiovibrio occultus TaxID=1891184 RepID=UPI000B352842|nr:enoyl-ACP reductase FabV [Thaumasiovibrio occultus]
MQITPIIHGVIARSAHPQGCHQAVLQQIEVAQAARIASPQRPRVLVLGASSGFGLASRIALTFSLNADTIGVSFERGPSENATDNTINTGSAGWYNNIAFAHEAEKAGHLAINVIGDAFSEETLAQTIQLIRQHVGQVDYVIYSLASGQRPDPQSDTVWRSVIKTCDAPFNGISIDIEHDTWRTHTVEVASQAECDATVKVMGGEDWQRWIDALHHAEVLAQNATSLAYSYIGPEHTYPVYHHGTLGQAKQHLQRTADALSARYPALTVDCVICKALVTKASVFIPGLSPYLIALQQVMKEKQLHEECIEQMVRLFTQKLIENERDDNGWIRLDDWELREDVQKAVQQCLALMTAENFHTVGDYQGFKQTFLQLNGFEFEGVDYHQCWSLDDLQHWQPEQN